MSRRALCLSPWTLMRWFVPTKSTEMLIDHHDGPDAGVDGVLADRQRVCRMQRYYLAGSWRERLTRWQESQHAR